MVRAACARRAKQLAISDPVFRQWIRVCGVLRLKPISAWGLFGLLEHRHLGLPSDSRSLTLEFDRFIGGRPTFLKCVEETNAGLLCMSALLPTTMPSMELTINAAKEAELRDKGKILVGGAPASDAFA